MSRLDEFPFAADVCESPMMRVLLVAVLLVGCGAGTPTWPDGGAASGLLCLDGTYHPVCQSDCLRQEDGEQLAAVVCGSRGGSRAFVNWDPVVGGSPWAEVCASATRC